MLGIKRKSIIIVAASALVSILVIASFALLNKNAEEPASPTTPTTTETTPESSDAAPRTETDVTDVTPAANDAQAVDPASLSFIDIEPLAISVAYTKGIPGFDFAIQRTANQTQYIEFTSPDLVGTKCTDDNGLIVSIIKNPSSTEDQTTIDQKVTVDGNIYGISLASNSCTKNVELLDQYQKAFLEGFSSLRVL